MIEFVKTMSERGKGTGPAGEIIVIFCTAPEKESKSLAHMLVDRRLVACVNIIPVKSYYRWEGKLVNDTEHLLVAKTASAKLGAVIESIKAVHSYTLPEIIVLPVIAGYAPYLEWVREETS